MKKFLITIFMAFLAPSCSMNFNEKTSSNFEEFSSQKEQHNYDEITHLKIEWNSLFFTAKTSYFVYFYSQVCSHCSSIKNDLIEYGLSHENFYFCEADETHKIRDNIEESIGSKSVDKFCILGYPSLAKFEDKTVTLNVAGVSSIYSILNI